MGNILALAVALALHGCVCRQSSKQNQYEIGDLATLYDLLPQDTQHVIEHNHQEVRNWQPYGDVDDALLDPASAAMQRKWNEWNAHITAQGNIDSARLLVSFGLLPALSSAGGTALHQAVMLNDSEQVLDLLNNPAHSSYIDIDAEKVDGSTPLIIAAIMGYTHLVELLLKEGAYTEARSSSGATALHFAACLNHTDIVRVLVDEYKADCNAAHPFAQSTALHFAVEMNNAHIVEILCASTRCDGEAEKSHGGRSIHIAAESNSTAAMVALIQHCHVDLESKLLNDTTAMYLAAQYGLTEMVELLIGYGAMLDPVMPTVARRDVMAYQQHQQYQGSPNIPNPEFDGMYYPDRNVEIGNGATPLHAATENGHFRTVQVLLAAGARQLASMEGANPLYVAVEYNQYGIAKLLLSYDASKSNIDHRIPRNGHSSLYLAVGLGRIKFVKLLLKHGADVHVQTQSGITPIYYACVRRRDDILAELLRFVDDKRALKRYRANDDGSNALHAAAQYACYECLQRLMDAHPYLLKTNTNDEQNVLHVLLAKKVKSTQSVRAIKQMVRKILRMAYKYGFAAQLVNQRSKRYGMTPLMLAVQNQADIEIIRVLLDERYEVDVNARASEQAYSATALFMACQNNHSEAVQELVTRHRNETDCNVRLYQRRHATPLYVAAEMGYAQIVRLLLYECEGLKLSEQEDEDAEGMNVSQTTPIHAACMNGHVDVVKVFMEYGITISVMDKSKEIRALSLHEVEPFCMNVHRRQSKVRAQHKDSTADTSKQEL